MFSTWCSWYDWFYFFNKVSPFSIFSSKFQKDLELLFAKAEVRRLDLDVLYWSEAHHGLVGSKQYRRIYNVTLKHPCDLVINLSKVWVRILLNEIIFVSDNSLNFGQYGSSSRKEKRALFLRPGVQFVKKVLFCRM